jgi:hypothetical protein
MRTKKVSVGSKVSCESRWGYIEGVVTKVYGEYTFNDQDDQPVMVPEIANVKVTSKLPERWPYSIAEFAPETSKLRLR